MNIYEQLIAQIEATHPYAKLSMGDICVLDQDIAFLREIPRLLTNPNMGQNLLVSSQRVFNIASRWLGNADGFNKWLQTYVQAVGA